MQVTFLGTGGSSGTPAVDRGWGACDPENPKNRRLRPSILVQNDDTTILVDTSPDLRQQLLEANVRSLDAVLYTHDHADHLHGIDDLRPVNRAMNAPLDVFADSDTLAAISERFGYVFEPLDPSATVYYKPTLMPHTLSGGETFTVGSLDITAFRQDHGYGSTLGFRFGDLAYSTDVVDLPEDSFACLEGVKTWIIGTLVDEPHPTHAHVDKALGWIERVGAEQGYLTHISPSLDHGWLENRLPDHVRPAYDGLVISV